MFKKEIKHVPKFDRQILKIQGGGAPLTAPPPEYAPGCG